MFRLNWTWTSKKPIQLIWLFRKKLNMAGTWKRNCPSMANEITVVSISPSLAVNATTCCPKNYCLESVEVDGTYLKWIQKNIMPVFSSSTVATFSTEKLLLFAAKSLGGILLVWRNSAPGTGPRITGMCDLTACQDLSEYLAITKIQWL